MLNGRMIASINYLLRVWRWHKLPSWLGHRLPAGSGWRIHIAGLALTSSPGKLGETLRSVLLLPAGIRLPRSLAAFFADRLSDVMGVALLGATASWIASNRHVIHEGLFVGVLALSVGLRAVFASRAWRSALARLDHQQGHLGDRLAVLSLPAPARALLWPPGRMIFCVLCATVAYGIQASAFVGYASATGESLPWSKDLAIFASTSLIAAVSMIPARLGAMEVTLVDAGVQPASAVAAVFLPRLSTLWFSVLLGSLVLRSFARNSSEAPVPRARPRVSP